MSYKYFYDFGDMLIGSKIPPQADIIKIVIVGGYPRVSGHDCFREPDYREKPNNLELTQPAKVLILNVLADKAKVRLPIFSHNLHFVARCMLLTLSNIYQTTTCRLF